MSGDDGNTKEPDGRDTTTRRGVLGLIGAGVLYALGFFSGSASANHGGNLGGDIANDSEPATHVFTEQVVHHPRTSDPSSPQDGVSWYNESP